MKKSAPPLALALMLFAGAAFSLPSVAFADFTMGYTPVTITTGCSQVFTASQTGDTIGNNPSVAVFINSGSWQTTHSLPFTGHISDVVSNCSSSLHAGDTVDLMYISAATGAGSACHSGYSTCSGYSNQTNHISVASLSIYCGLGCAGTPTAYTASFGSSTVQASAYTILTDIASFLIGVFGTILSLLIALIALGWGVRKIHGYIVVGKF